MKTATLEKQEEVIDVLKYGHRYGWYKINLQFDLHEDECNLSTEKREYLDAIVYLKVKERDKWMFKNCTFDYGKKTDKRGNGTLEYVWDEYGADIKSQVHNLHSDIFLIKAKFIGWDLTDEQERLEE